MKSTLFIFAVLFGVALADDGKQLTETESEGRLFVGLPTIITLIQLGAQIIILLALINFVTSLKGSIDFDNLFGKGGDDYGYADYGGGYDSGYPAPAVHYDQPAAPVGGSGSSYTNYKRTGHVEKRSIPAVNKLTAKVYEALEKFTN